MVQGGLSNTGRVSVDTVAGVVVSVTVAGGVVGVRVGIMLGTGLVVLLLEF